MALIKIVILVIVLRLFFIRRGQISIPYLIAHLLDDLVVNSSRLVFELLEFLHSFFLYFVFCVHLPSHFNLSFTALVWIAGVVIVLHHLVESLVTQVLNNKDIGLISMNLLGVNPGVPLLLHLPLLLQLERNSFINCFHTYLF